MRLIFELACKALWRSKFFSLIFMLNFVLAVGALSYLQFFKSSIDASLQTEAKRVLGADLVISSRFPITDEQKDLVLQKLPATKSFSEGISTVSMVSSPTRARLVEIVQLMDGYPYYGGLVFADKSAYPRQKLSLMPKQIWAYQEVLDLLDVRRSDTLKIGKIDFKIDKVIQSDTTKTVSFSGFLPKIYISKEGLKNSELLGFGSTARYQLRFAFAQPLDNNALEAIAKNLQTNIDSNLRILSPKDGTDRLLRVLDFLTTFLSLVSLVSFFLGLVGLVYLYFGYLKNHQKDIEILSDLGARGIIAQYLLHLFSLVMVASLGVLIFFALSASFLEPLIAQLIDFEFSFSWDYLFLVKSAGILLLLVLSIGLPLLLPLVRRQKINPVVRILSFTPFIILLLFVAFIVSPSANIGLWFAGALMVFVALIFAIGFYLLGRFDFSGHLRQLALSLAIKNITRSKASSLGLFSSIVLCTTLFSLIPQVGSTLSNMLSSSADERPRLFVLDAKEEQIPQIKAQVASKGARLENIAPMVRARLVAINDRDFTPSAQNESRASTVNLSYRATLKKSERLLQGRDFSGRYDSADFSKPAEISVEQRYAKRNGIALGDQLLFDVLGLKIEAIVVNIRSVQWTEFVPNFFLLLQEGVLEDAPKSMLATISAGEYNAQEMIIELSGQYPSLSIVDVKSLFESFANLVEKVRLIAQKMSLFTIGVGLLMSFIIIQYQMNLQKNNILRLKMIGVQNCTIKKTFLIEYGLITISASALGVALGSLGSYVISRQLFDAYLDFRADILLLYFILIPILSLSLVYYLSTKITQQKENILFGE